MTIDIERRKKALKYLLGYLPSVWQLPNAVKIHEYLELTKDFKPSQGNRVLDLGCGMGIQTQLLARSGARVTGVEPNLKRYNLAERELKWSRLRRNVDFINGTLEDADFHPESFDSMISFCVLEHIPNLDEVLKNIYRLLKKGGEVHATVDSLSNIDDPALIDKHKREHAVVQYFNLETIDETLKRAGFVVYEKRYILRGPDAKKALEDELRTGNYFTPAFARKKAFDELVLSETSSDNTQQGTMILCRARKV